MSMGDLVDDGDDDDGDDEDSAFPDELSAPASPRR